MTTTAPAPHGPGTIPTLRPGQRGTALIITEGHSTEDALRQAIDWIKALEAGCDPALDAEGTALYAVALAGDLTPHLRPEDTSPELAQHLDAILTAGQWQTRGENAQDWAQTYQQALTTADPQALCTAWDVYPHR